MWVLGEAAKNQGECAGRVALAQYANNASLAIAFRLIAPRCPAIPRRSAKQLNPAHVGVQGFDSLMRHNRVCAVLSDGSPKTDDCRNFLPAITNPGPRLPTIFMAPDDVVWVGR